MNLDELLSTMRASHMERWAEILSAQIEKGMDTRRYGDLPEWQAAYESLPSIKASGISLDRGCIEIGSSTDTDDESLQKLREVLTIFHPWRKGPYRLFGIHIDTEWRSDWKWQRLKNYIQPLKGRTVLDVGCGNGYHCWRMRGAGAAQVIGIDPMPLFSMQFEVIRKYIGDTAVNVLPMGIDDVPEKLEAFDTVFSMGVLYHRRSPIDHILQLRDCLKPGGELVLETLVIDGDEQQLLIPEDRYARMGNVWFIPSVAMLEKWCRRCKLSDIRVVDVTTTTTEEQRATEWMSFQSLKDFLDPRDTMLTIEGYPAPKRAILVARKPND